MKRGGFASIGRLFGPAIWLPETLLAVDVAAKQKEKRAGELENQIHRPASVSHAGFALNAADGLLKYLSEYGAERVYVHRLF